ncbi:MAG: hypothetical protein E7223_04460 [Clostridiales bacterium]|nr:hypothetical protein [Clostridiales bacterium]
MAKKNYWGFDKKNADRRRRGQDYFYELGKALKKMPSGRKRKGKKRSYSSKKTYSGSKTRNSSTHVPVTQYQAQEPATFGDFMFGLGFMAVIIIILILFLVIGFWKTILLAAGIFVAIIVILVAIELVKENKKNQKTTYSEDRSNQIPYIKSLLGNLKRYQDVANTSNNPDEVKKNLDYLLGVIDEIMTFDEALLKQAGMTKVNAVSVKEDILKVYDEMIAQAGQTDEMDSAITEQATESSLPEEIAKPQPIVSKEGIIPLETLLKTATLSKQGLYPHEILMLHYANTYKVGGGNSFQHFWLYQYSVGNPQNVLNSLLERGFLVIGDLKSALERQTVIDIKAELQAIGEKTAGKKAELITRLLNSGNIDRLEVKYPERYYALTEAAIKELEENEYVLYLHRTKRMSVWDMNYMLFHDNPLHLRYRDILWREFNIQAGEHFKVGDMGLYRNTRMNMYQFLMEEDRIKSAFTMLCEVVAYDLSGMGNQEIFQPSEEMKKVVMEYTLKSCFPYNASSATMPPAVIEWMTDIKEQLGMSEKEFRAALLENFEKIKLFRRIFTNEECVEIVMNEINNHPRKQAAIYKQAEERMRREYESLNIS